MNEPFETKAAPADPTRKLSAAIRDVKNALADREDVVVEMREASRMRLELLAQELEDVFEDVPADDQQFDFAISSGLVPRLWIDSTAHVAMGRDKRAFRFVRDTRLGRVVLAESSDMNAVGDAVTRYVAERIVERRRMMEGGAELPAPRPSAQPRTPAAEAAERADRTGMVFTALTLLLIGAAIGAAGVLAWLWDKIPPPIRP